MDFLYSAFLPMLMGWSALWLTGAVVALWLLAGRGFWRSFWFMSGLWCIVNTAIGVWSLLDPPESIEQFRRLLLINSGLDVVYLIVGGVLLLQRQPMPRGFGAAICLQGLALLVFDLVWWRVLGEG